METEDIVDEMINAISEDFTLDELTDLLHMTVELSEILDLGHSEALALLSGAIKLALLRQDRPNALKVLLTVH